MSSVELTLALISKQISVYVGFPMLFIGVISNILNITIFTQLTIFRGKQSSFYLTTGSIVDCIQLLVTFSFRTLANGFNYDPGRTSIIWCKLKPLVAQTCAIVSMGTVSFAAIDQYFSTSCHIKLRQLSTLRLSHLLTCVLITLALLHGIPCVCFYTISPNGSCVSSNTIFSAYISFVHYFILIGILPISTSSFFAALAYLNVRRIIRHQVPIIQRKLDQQLTAMILLRVCLLTITLSPFISFQIYQFITPINPNNTLRTAIEQLLGVIIYGIQFLNYTASFSVFLISSRRFRRQVKYLLFKKIWRKCCLQTRVRSNPIRRNQVDHVSHISVVDVD